MSYRRQATISRKTNETSIEVYLDLDCAPGSAVAQEIEISTGIGFLDHVLLLLRGLQVSFSWTLPDVSCAG